ncbi:hypothetical protein FSP39_002419 [Pinctada imbricata]|uniref:E3 ubiquitin-protein ligase n=1 Tax=Pinctada imbricata TaxID=66713 RepID=A0AA88YFM7_PINIB|nr:hypothetical protein FSP39_002419 [Pinctada imbricata]
MDDASEDANYNAWYGGCICPTFHALVSRENVKGEGSTAEDEQLEIFETIKADINSGLQHLGETELKKTLSHTGNYVALDTGGRQISLRAASMSGLEEAQDRLTLASKDDVHTSKPRVEEPKIHISNRTIECEHLDSIAFRYFAESEAWYKGVANEISWNRNQITLKGKAVQYETEVTEALKKIKETGKEVIEFSSDEFDKFDNVLKEIRESFQDEYIFEFHSGHKIFMISDSYETRRKFKHKGDVLLGKVKVTQGRRQRRFNDASQEADKADADMDVRPKADMDARPKTSSRIGRQFGVAGKENFSTSQVSSGGSSASFTTQEGIIIKVYSGSITRLSVDCIVNAANENLMHGGGVAYAISNAAGYKFDAESREYVKKHGPINVGECCTTGAGDLPYKCVIHTVGPRWGDYRHNEKWQCEDDLQRAVEVTFTEAVKQGCQTVALPAISSGIFGVPWEVCVKQYYQAVVAYSQTATSPIKEIHFVDKDQRMVDCISSKFREYFEGKLPEKDLKTIGSTTVIQKKDNEGSSMAGAGKLDESLRKSATQDKRVSEPIVGQVTFQIDAGITLCVVVGDMLKLKVEAVVCPQDVKFKSFGRVAKAIMNAAGEVHGSGEEDKLLREGRVGDVKVLKASLAVNWEYIFHAVPPRWSSKVVSGSFDYDLARTFKHILYEAQQNTVKSIAMPLLGIGDGNFNGVVDKNVHTLSTELEDLAKYKRQKDYKLQLNIVCQKNEVMLRLVKGFEGKFKKVEKEVEESSAAEKEKEDPISQPSTAKGMMEPVQPGDDSETCPICMDSFTEAQKLTKCGHIFCLECIQEYFSKCKPSCPNCGVIYGKVTGDQPNGNIRFMREGTRLPGYDRYGCIKVTYTFYDGIQGEDHPKPGTPYKGISRSGYLPDNTEGKLAAKLLNVAFSRKLVFTIGRSRTTGEEGVLTWNDIHHKTRIHGGTDRFAYPDPTYIERVMDEMAVKGVTIESADDPNEYKEYSRVFYK